MRRFGRRKGVQLVTALERPGDGRNVDPALGTLSGEGAAQEVRRLAPAHPAPESLTTMASHAGPSDPVSPSYYGVPCVKTPVWDPSVPLYFFLGGLSGATSVLGVVAERLGGPELRGLTRRCRWVGTVGNGLSAVLLISDLGRPERFLHMLRVFRPTSPMSVGAWILTVSGSANGLALVLMNQRGRLGRLGDTAALVGGLLGGPLAGYTAVLLSNTAVPLWQGARLRLPLLFTASSVVSAAGVLSLMAQRPAEARVLRVYGLAGKVAEWVGMRAVERELSRHPELVRPLREGPTGTLWRAVKVSLAAGLVLSLLPGRRVQRTANVLSGLASLGLRYAVFSAGKVSSRNPQATFKPQREGFGAAEVTGHAHASDGRPFQVPLPVVPEQRVRVPGPRPSEEQPWAPV